jgi:tryptophanyl-tRNA synthetase
MNKPLKRALTGIRPSGSIHIGNYLGAIREGLKLQQEYECLYFIADMHALTTTKSAEEIRDQSLDIVACWVALGLDTSKHLMYRQSDIPMVGEYAWYLSCCTGMGFLQKAHSYKDAVAKDKEVNHGVFAYPVLMAADILMYDSDVVPVGKDQKQHVEMARNMAGSINAIYGEGVVHLPQPMINEDVMTIPGLDGRKMSKSYNNTIPLFGTEKELKKKLMSVETDSSTLEDPKTLKGTLLGDLFALFASDSQFIDLEKRLAAGGLGWGHAKLELFELVNEHLQEPRKKYLELKSNPDQLDAILNDGARRALAIAEPVLNRMRNAMGFRNFPYSLNL